MFAIRTAATAAAAAAAVSACLAAAPMAALAQAAAPGAGATSTAPEATAPGTAPVTDLDRKPGSLSSKLGDTNGVIKPSGDVDPAMHKEAPQSGTMPVIKPGQTGGGVAK